MTPAEGKENLDTPRSKCAHPACKCLRSTSPEYGEYCSEYCKENGALTELRCQCEHPECR